MKCNFFHEKTQEGPKQIQAIEESAAADAAKDAAKDAAGRVGARGEAAAGRGQRFMGTFQKELKKGMRDKLK